ncbi:uncharacterized protein [Littorina saxatilis]|uniref:Uncharacterized protein n=1 Tax=Littorina saxatilis TaxID=31220 RepID=A0AAN9AY55_9CAEN
MLKFVLLSFAAVALAQFPQRPGWMDEIVGGQVFEIDTIHGHSVQYDDKHDLLLLVGKANCYLIDAPDNTWDKIAHNADQVPRITEDIYHQITSGKGVMLMTHPDAIEKYHSVLEQYECRSKEVFHVEYHLRHHN